MKADEKALIEFPISEDKDKELERRKARVFYAMGYWQAVKDCMKETQAAFEMLKHEMEK